MAWIELHDEIYNHPKTLGVAGVMGWSKYEAVGRLTAFFHWALKYRPTGDLRGHNDEVLGNAVELNGEAASRFVKAMVASCWIDRSDGVFRIHDWPDFTKRYLRDSKFKDKPHKWLEVLEVYRDLLPNDSRGTPEFSAVPNQPNQPNTPHSPPRAGGGESRRPRKGKGRRFAEALAAGEE